MKKLKKNDLSYFIRKNNCDEDGAQNYLVFQSMLEYFTLNIKWITKWRSKGLSNESIKVVCKTDNTLTQSISYYWDKAIKFTRSVLQEKTVRYSHKRVVNVYIIYKVTNFHSTNNYPRLTNALFGAVKLTKNADIDKYKYSGYGIGFDGHGSFSHPSGGTGKNIIIFGVDMSSSTKIDNKRKDILILGKGTTQGLGGNSLYAEKMYSINFTKVNTKFCLSLHHNGANSYLFVNGIEIQKFTAKDSMVVPYNLCLGNISKDFSASNMKKTGFNAYISDFSVDYNSTDANHIKDGHKYLMK